MKTFHNPTFFDLEGTPKKRKKKERETFGFMGNLAVAILYIYLVLPLGVFDHKFTTTHNSTLLSVI